MRNVFSFKIKNMYIIKQVMLTRQHSAKPSLLTRKLRYCLRKKEMERGRKEQRGEIGGGERGKKSY